MSKDTSTKVSAVAFDNDQSLRLLATGYNGFASGYPDDYESIDRNIKYLLTVHAEVNLVANAARNGTSLVGSMVVISEPPCPQCLSVLINAGVAELVFPPFEECEHYERWKEQFNVSKQILAYWRDGKHGKVQEVRSH